jgi:hypothetical protein
MAKIRLTGGKPILIGGKVGLNDDCCCNPPVPPTGACCYEFGCFEGTEASCIAAHGTYQGDGTTCFPDPCNVGACCDPGTFVCTDGVSHDDCVSAGGIYIGNGSTCVATECNCCPFLDHYTAISFSGQVIGCSGGTVSLPSKTWTKVASGGGCDVDTFQFATDLNCSCQFNAQNCFPFTEVDYIEIDDVGDCDSPASYNGCVELAHINCADGTVTFEASTSTTCCSLHPGAILFTAGPYDLTGGSVDVTVVSDTDPTIRFRFILTLL